MKHLRMLLSVLILTLAMAMPALAVDYDVVINNGRVMDPETMFDDIANVGITKGRIVAISKQPLSGTETIDATGHVVAPGFIDTHYHATDVFASKMALRDGVTTGMDLDAGLVVLKPRHMHQLKTLTALDTIAATIAYYCCGKDCGLNARWRSTPQTIACHYKCQVSSVEDYSLLTDIPFFYSKITSGNLQKNIKRYKAYKGIKILAL